MPGEYKSSNEFGEFGSKMAEWSYVARHSRHRGDGTCWIERRPPLAHGLAWLGILVGLVLLIIPGLFAIRSVLRWHRLGITPDLAWNLGLLGIWTAIGAAIWFAGILLVALIVPLPGWLFSMSAIRR